MQMAISTTGRRPLCIFCSVSVLSKMLKLRSAEGSSFRLWWLLSVFCCWSSLLDAVSFLLLRRHPGARHQTHNVECSEVRLFRWWACSGSNRLFLCWLWSIRCLFLREATCWVWHSDLSHWSHCQNVVVWVVPRVSEDLCLDAVGHCECSSILSTSRIAKMTLIGNVAA
jgi:hypothetical protein